MCLNNTGLQILNQAAQDSVAEIWEVWRPGIEKAMVMQWSNKELRIADSQGPLAINDMNLGIKLWPNKLYTILFVFFL